MPVKIFFCYSREDELFLNRLKSHLRPLQRQGLIEVWHDRDISAGTEWEQEINKHLNTAQIILLLISPNFMDSEYCYSIEMKRALERHVQGEARVVPIILRYAYWQGEPLGKLQALPKAGKPVKSWQDEDEAFFNVVEGIHKVVKELTAKAASNTSIQKSESLSTVLIGEFKSVPSLQTDWSSLVVGRMLLGRYEITQVISESSQEHVYQVIDRQGYQYCWNCGSEKNAEGDEFCLICGASMLDVPYLLHEYSAMAASAEVNSILQGTIVNRFVERGRHYAIEQSWEIEDVFPRGVYLQVAHISDAGYLQRDRSNEDTTLVLLNRHVLESKEVPIGVFIVADGEGGDGKGQIASHTITSTFADHLKREFFAKPLIANKDGGVVKLLDEDSLIEILDGAVEEANTTLVQINQNNKTDMFSTITGFMVVGEHAYILNVGDSRTYMLRGKQLYQLTTDHSLVGQLVAGGLIEPDDMYTHPQRNQIFRSLGNKPNVKIDIFKQELFPGDILLSCSDGLWDMVRNPQIESILNNAPDPETACTRFIEAANANGGVDNISAIIVFVNNKSFD